MTASMCSLSCSTELNEAPVSDLEPGFGISRNHLVHEIEELFSAPAFLVRSLDLAGGAFKGREQGRRGVPFVVVAVFRQHPSVRQLQIALAAYRRAELTPHRHSTRTTAPIETPSTIL